MRVLVLVPLLAALATGSARAQVQEFEQARRASATLELAVERGAPPELFARPTVIDALAPRRHTGQRSLGTTLMIIGGGAILVGAVTGGGGGTVLIVGGVVCTGYGFYLYQQ